jgi:hypothetical protein
VDELLRWSGQGWPVRGQVTFELRSEGRKGTASLSRHTEEWFREREVCARLPRWKRLIFF